MERGFYTIMAAQFFSSLADNALLVVAIALLIDLHAPAYLTPMLKFVFVLFYVILAPFVGAFADSMPKGRVMFISNTIKILGCGLLFIAAHQYFAMAAYAVVGLGAAAYSPAKYGILTELLPPEKLVIANGWIEGLTVTSIVLGTVMGGILITPTVASVLMEFDFPVIDTGINSALESSILLIAIIYTIAASFNLYIPNTGVDHRIPKKNPFYLIHEFAHCIKLLWTDKLGQISLAVTTLFWGAGATLQFIVLKWAEVALNYPLNQAAQLQGVVAVGIAIGAIMAARWISLRHSVKVIPLGIAMGVVVMAMILVKDLWIAIVLLMLIGGLAGFFVVPMNALLQHRGHILMGAGHSIAVQNFNENLSILTMLSLYAVLILLEVHIYTVIVAFGLFVSVMMALIRKWHLLNQSKEDSLHLIGARKIH
ncbi:MAG: lysophospholipid transporter LplT [Nitrosomonas sp.]|uniref:lysophospholipid transporter LplT n=1 Tax=Nitrosomonas sp. TaxID=42353 RepID=UPI00271AF0F5|nr:lysophospholipid transporter LplT [Nitrosomonas sp.]MDO8895486.1 lysophospholipid transporter LplT [Nitrosomonas sp.]MDO9470854.1 lysophospholipid transporter LplT [Nitrosomonas sp.]MDP1549348.1 lysophospholipid transporter LplT [Nitrosomonas sp.]MDP1788035.1 lysophospholipid transporter LplT [Nitrosomonas sp.]MDP1935422.1 lysophospholipid transporter LplT [Nitrosomonas sp.]